MIQKTIKTKVIVTEYTLVVTEQDLETIVESLKYCLHRIRSHPESGIKNVTNKKVLQRIVTELS